MIYHFMGGSPYIKKFISFMIENKNHFNLDEHFFIINDSGKFKLDTELIQQIKHVRLESKWDFIGVLNKLSKKDKLIIHGLFNPRLLAYLFINRRMIKRCTWSIWGGDVYFYKYKSNSLRHNLIEFLRRSVIPEIPVVTALVKGDYEIIREVYGSNAKYIYSFYPNPVDFQLIDEISISKEKQATKTVMIGNSGDPSNNHGEIFEMLKRFKDEDIRVICPLSYGDTDYINKTIYKGQKAFGSKFIPLTEYLPPEDYIRVIAEVDVAIMNHNRQQGLGNIIMLLAMGKKVYIREGTSHFQFFIENEIEIYGIESLYESSFTDIFTMHKEQCNKNMIRVKQMFSNNSYIRMWNDVFKGIY